MISQKAGRGLNQKGFTLIELLIVIAIIGILAAIAIPAFLGQREKAKIRSVEAGAKGSIAEIQSWLDALVVGGPYLYRSTGDDKICVEAEFPAPGRSCADYYSGKYAGSALKYDDGVEDIMDHIVAHHYNQGERSPYDETVNLFQRSGPLLGTVYITNIGTAIKVLGYGATDTAIIFNTTVSAL